MRAWLPAAGLSLIVAMPAQAATRVTIQDLKDHPARYYDQSVLLECFYDKESPIWVRALPEAETWIGFFVTGKPEKALTWSGEYYNLLFAPAVMRDTIRTLRSGDHITVIGEAFHYQSAGFDGAGIRATQVRQGWGESARPAGDATPAQPAPAASTSSSPGCPERYLVTINGTRYRGLRFGDQYTFDGVEFQVEPNQ